MKSKKLMSLLILVCVSFVASGQGMAVNGSGAAADASAMLDISSTNQGVLVPRMTGAQRTSISGPATGLLVYQTDATAGFYFYNGAAWVPLNSTTTTAGGDLTGTYPNPTIATGAVTNAKLANSSVTINGSNVALGAATTVSATPSGAAGGNLTGTYPNPTIASLPAISGANLTNLNASNISSGNLSTSRLNSGTGASSTTFWRGDGTWATPAGGGGSTNGMNAGNIGIYTLSPTTSLQTIDVSAATNRLILLDENNTFFTNTNKYNVRVTLGAASAYPAGSVLLINFINVTPSNAGYYGTLTFASTGSTFYNVTNSPASGSVTYTYAAWAKIVSDGISKWYFVN